MANSVPETDFTFRDLLRILDRKRQAAIGTGLAIFLVAVLACIFMTRRYEAKSVFQFEKSNSDSLGLEDMISSAGGGAADSLSVNIDLQTQATILESDSLELQVIKELDLEHNKDFEPHFNPINFVLGLITPKGSADPHGASLDDSPNRRARLLRVFDKNLKVKVNEGTRLIEVSYMNRDPRAAAAIANHLVQALIDFNFQTKFLATQQVSTWLENQLGGLRKESEDLQSKVVALQQGSGIYGVGGMDLNGKPVVYSPILDRLQQSSALLSQAEMNRVLKGSVYEIAKTGNAEMISELSGTGMMSQSGQGVTTSLTLIQNLRTQEATLQAQVDQDASKFGSAYPKLVDERASLRGLQKLLNDEVGRIAQRAKNDYDVAVQTETGAKSTYDADQSAAEKLNDKTIEYTILEKESEESQDLYQDLLKRLREAGILEGLKSSSLTVVDIARPPAVPNRPNVPLYLGLGLGLGMFLGGCAAFAADAIDNKVQGPEEIEGVGIPLLALIPKVQKSESQVIQLDGTSVEFSESIRRLRSTLLISKGGEPPRILLVTSGSPGEGKSTVALNLAGALSQYGNKVLLVEADMRRPVLRRRLGLTMKGGLSTVLADVNSHDHPEVVDKFPNLYVLPAGPVAPFPSELLGSGPLRSLFDRWTNEYQFVVVDSPPVLPVTDVQILEAFADSTIFVVRGGLTTRVALQRAYHILLPHAKIAAAPNIGVVLNAISTNSAGYYEYYGQYGYENYYGKNGDSDGKA